MPEESERQRPSIQFGPVRWTRAPAAAETQATALYRSGQFEQALATAEATLGDESSASLRNVAAASARALGRLDEAERHWRETIIRHPQYADAYNNLGVLLVEQGRRDDALPLYRRAIELNPDYAAAHANLGTLLKHQRAFAEAESCYRRAIAIQPGNAEAHNGLGSLLADLGRPQEAEAAYRAAIDLRPGYAGAHANLAILHYDQGRQAQAEAGLRRALAEEPGYADASCSLGMLLLSLGRYPEGWPLYEARLDPQLARPIPQPPLPFPRWTGEDLAGKSIVVWQEQGFGDDLQFVRYLPFLKSRGAKRVTLVCKTPLKQLMQSAAGADRVIASGDVLERHDFWTMPGSLPGRCATTLDAIPNRLPYLSADAQRIAAWRNRLPVAPIRVGLVWKGFPSHKNDARRSLPSLATLAPLWSVPGIAFVSLQKGEGEDEAATPPIDQPLVHLGADIEDFADTAAIVSQLDLVICVDTAVAHVAGALAKPCWILLPALGCDWRWLTGRTDSPWYPGVVRLFRQRIGDDWPTTVRQVAQALGRFAEQQPLR